MPNKHSFLIGLFDTSVYLYGGFRRTYLDVSLTASTFDLFAWLDTSSSHAHFACQVLQRPSSGYVVSHFQPWIHRDDGCHEDRVTWEDQ